MSDLYQNKYAGYETYFTPLFPVRTGKGESYLNGGYEITNVNGKWICRKAQYYNRSLKDNEDFPVVGKVKINILGYVRDMMLEALKKRTDEQIKEDAKPEIMSDGTLHITVNADVANIDRILLSQAGTHTGDLYYKDDEKPEPQWIPVAKRLPEPRTDVWVNSDIGQIQGYYEERVETWYASFGQGRDYLELIVNAWMPLPEPYQKGE